MRKFIVKSDCYCRNYLIKRLNYPIEDIFVMKLFKGDVVELEEEWTTNFYGIHLRYMRVIKNEKCYIIKTKHLQEIL